MTLPNFLISTFKSAETLLRDDMMMLMMLMMMMITGRKNGFEAGQMWSKYESNVIFVTFIHI